MAPPPCTYVICFHKSNNSRVVLILIQPKFEDRGIGSNCPSSAHVRKIFVSRKAYLAGGGYKFPIFNPMI